MNIMIKTSLSDQTSVHFSCEGKRLMFKIWCLILKFWGEIFSVEELEKYFLVSM